MKLTGSHRYLLLTFVLAVAQAHGETHCVNPGGTGGCFASVQAAVDAASNNELVTIAAGTYTENVVIGGAHRRLHLEGEDPTTTILDGGGTASTVLIPGPSATVSLTRLGIQNSGPGTDAGVAIQSARVTATRCRITGNAGSGIAGGSTRLIVVESTIDGNGGAGMDVYGMLRVLHSTISGNAGGGISSDRAIIEDSTISGNGSAGIVVGSRLRLVRSTVVANSGGGIYVSVAGRGRTKSSIVANNVPYECDVYVAVGVPLQNGLFISRGYNLIEGECPFVGGAGTDVTAQDPLLGPLQDNGGPTFTHALGPGSPALGHVARSRDCKAPDQRGVARALPCDIGAFEAP